jgi:putative pyruvate formate lyase activating enzyme
MSPELARRYSNAPDYAFWAGLAVVEMQRQTGPPQKDGGGLLVKGTLVRHLVLPGAWRDSVAVLDKLAEILPEDGFLLT